MKSNIDFSKVLEKNHKKMQNTPVSDLLKSTTTKVVDSYEQTHTFPEQNLTEQLFKMEGLIQSLIINQQSLASQLKNQIPHKSEIKQKQSLTAFQGLLILILAVLMSYLAYVFRTHEKVPTATVETTKPQKTRYFINKYINLRLDSSTRSDVLTVLAPNSIIEVLEKKESWTKIKYYNHVESQTFTGWIWGEAYKAVFSEARL